MVAYGKKIDPKIDHSWKILEPKGGFNSFRGERTEIQNSEIDESEGPVWIGKEVKITNSEVRGPAWVGARSEIGPFALIRTGSIAGNCKIGHSVEIKNSVIGRNTKVPHLSYVGDSVIGSWVNLAAGTITSNLRHDENTVKVRLEDEEIDTGRRKLGAIVGDCVKTGIKTVIYEGRILGPFSFTCPGVGVRHNLKPFKILDEEGNSTLRKEQLKAAFPRRKGQIDKLWDELCAE